MTPGAGWAINPDNMVSRLDPASGRRVAVVQGPDGAEAIAAGDVSLLPELAAAHLDNAGRMGFSPLAQLVEKDNATAYAYYALMQRFMPLPVAPPSADAPVPPERGRGRRGMGMGGA